MQGCVSTLVSLALRLVLVARRAGVLRRRTPLAGQKVACLNRLLCMHCVLWRCPRPPIGQRVALLSHSLQRWILPAHAHISWSGRVRAGRIGRCCGGRVLKGALHRGACPWPCPCSMLWRATDGVGAPSSMA